jgi:hypothetical protein
MARPAADPDTPEHRAAYHSAGMSHFMDVVAGCQALAFSKFTDGAIGAGVGLEIARVLQLGLPTFDISAGRLEPVHVLPAPSYRGSKPASGPPACSQRRGSQRRPSPRTCARSRVRLKNSGAYHYMVRKRTPISHIGTSIRQTYPARFRN